jgi:2-dehydro-3-deoxygalactonokinase
MGTTNTRVWLTRGDEVLARASKLVGVRDTAHTGSRATIDTALKVMIADVRNQVPTFQGKCVIAAGMISSQLGLKDLPYVPAPAGIRDISEGSRWFEFPEITDLPILLVPGVRCGPETVDLDSIDELDVMRGEETLCLGLIALRLVSPPCVVMNLGSHWKAIQINVDEKIQASRTSLSGELVHPVKMHTVLASSLPKNAPAEITQRWLEAGIDEQRRSGLSRAMFCVRLLELAGEGTPDERFSFLLGGLISTDLDALVDRGMIGHNTQITICGNPTIADAWRRVLSGNSIGSHVLCSEEIEKAFLSGLRFILQEVPELGAGTTTAHEKQNVAN